MKGAFIVFRNSIDFSMLSFISCNLTESICLIGLFLGVGWGGEGMVLRVFYIQGPVIKKHSC